jgi:hypothetical protein
MFKIIRIPSYKVAFILLGLAFFYDIFWVFFSDYFFGKSVMATVATNIDLPMKLSCPDLNASYFKHCSIIGLGDLVLPGVFLGYCYRFGKYYKDELYH